MAVDDAGAVHMVWVGSDRTSLVHAWRSTSGGWSNETVATGALVPRGLAADGTGGLHVVHQDEPSGQLAWTRRPAGGPWTTSVVTSASGEAGLDATLAIDGAGGLHVAHGVEGEGLVHSYRPSGGPWSSTTVASGYGHASSIAVGASGEVHISSSTHRSGSPGTLSHFAGMPGGPFTTRRVDTGELPGGALQSDLAIDARGYVHLVWETERETRPGSGLYSPETRYGMWAGGGDWSGHELRDLGIGPVALDVDDGDRLHVVTRVGAVGDDTILYGTGGCL